MKGLFAFLLLLLAMPLQAQTLITESRKILAGGPESATATPCWNAKEPCSRYGQSINSGMMELQIPELGMCCTVVDKTGNGQVQTNGPTGISGNMARPDLWTDGSPGWTSIVDPPLHIYGPALRADSLSNIPLNARNITVSWTFVATRSEPLLGIRLTSPIRAGYTAGTGGDIFVEVLGTPYAGFIFQNATDPYAFAYFAPTTSLIAGQTYTVNVRNVADDPVNNWRSVDGLVVNQGDPLDQPNSTVLNGQAHSTNWPMWEVLYASTVDQTKSPSAQGMGYVDVPVGAAVALPNARECFTPAAPITVVSGAVSLRGLSQPGTITLAGVTAVLYPPAVPNGWSAFYFATPLVIAVTQCLQPFSGQTGVTAVPLQKGWYRDANGTTMDFIYGPQTWFPDGHAQQLLPNGTWVDWISEQGANDPRMDLMFYLVTQ